MTAPKEYIGADAERITRLFQEQHAEIERLQEKVRNLTKWYDDQNGTPCEQIRHEQEIERLKKIIFDLGGTDK